jgi:alpha-tubulin suppressor-like RCC1 family protein
VKLRAVSCLFVMAWLTMAVAGCGSHSSSPPTTSKPKIAGGYAHSLALKNDGSLRAWGLNRGHELGLGDRKTRQSPTRVGVANDWAQVACGWYGSLALKTDGSLWSWGEVLAQLGLGHHPSGRAGNVPTQVGTATDWAAIAAGEMHSLALRKNGSLWAWGHNNFGQLGIGDTTDRHEPTRVPGW